MLLHVIFCHSNRRPRLPTAPSDSLTRLRDRSNPASNVKSKFFMTVIAKCFHLSASCCIYIFLTT